MQILFDGNALQSQAHLRAIGSQPAGVRLDGLLAALKKELSAEVKFSTEGEPLPVSALEDADVLAIPTRPPEGSLPDGTELSPRPYTEGELDRIERFVEQGKGLVLLANHTGFAREDDRLAERFGVDVLDFTYYNHPSGDCILEDTQLTVHPIVSGGSEGESVDQIVFDTSGVLWKSTPEAVPVVRLPSHEKAFFALAVQSGLGRVVLVADSGFLGSKNPQGRGVPGPGGFFGRADNRPFVLNTFRWAAGKLT